jgi:hypothetical protein
MLVGYHYYLPPPLDAIRSRMAVGKGPVTLSLMQKFSVAEAFWTPAGTAVGPPSSTGGPSGASCTALKSNSARAERPSDDGAVSRNPRGGDLGWTRWRVVILLFT